MKSKLISSYFSLTIHRLFFIFSGLIFWLLLDLSYQIFVHVNYDKSSFSLNITSKYWEALLLYVILLCSVPKIFNKPSDFFMNIFLFGYITPLLVFYGLADQQRSHLYIVLMGYFIIDIVKRGKLFSIPLIKSKYMSTIVFFLLISGALLTTVWFIINLKNLDLNFNFDEVYHFRHKSVEIINFGAMGYINNWAYYVFGQILLIFALSKRQYFWVIVIMLLYVFWFTVSNHKIVLFIPVFTIIFFLFFFKNKFLIILPLILTINISICLLTYYIADVLWISDLFIRRALFIPSFLTFTYYEFFFTHQFIYWSDSILSRFIDYPYHLDPPKLIGNYLGFNNDVSANNSFLSTGYMHLGVLGIIIYSALVGLLFKIIDSIGNRGISSTMSTSILIIPIITLITSSDLFTALLTYGIGLSIIFLFLLRSKNKLIKKTKVFDE